MIYNERSALLDFVFPSCAKSRAIGDTFPLGSLCLVSVSANAASASRAATLDQVNPFFIRI